MRANHVTNWKTFREWVKQYQSPKLNDKYGDYFFHELEVLLNRLATGDIVHLDVSVERIPLTDLAGPNKDRQRRLESYTFLHENAWKVYILLHCNHPARKENENYSMVAYYAAFLKDTDGKLVYFRAYDKEKGMPLWNMTGLAKQLTKE